MEDVLRKGVKEDTDSEFFIIGVKRDTTSKKKTWTKIPMEM